MPDFPRIPPPDSGGFDMILQDLMRQAQVKKAQQDIDKRHLDELKAQAAFGASTAEMRAISPDMMSQLQGVKSPDEMYRGLIRVGAATAARKERTAAIEQSKKAVAIAIASGQDPSAAVAENQRLLTMPGEGMLSPEQIGAQQADLGTTALTSDAQRRAVLEERASSVEIAGQKEAASKRVELAARPAELAMSEASNRRQVDYTKKAELEANLTERYRTLAGDTGMPLESADTPQGRAQIDSANYTAKQLGLAGKEAAAVREADAKFFDKFTQLQGSAGKGKPDPTVSNDVAQLQDQASALASYSQGVGSNFVPTIEPTSTQGWLASAGITSPQMHIVPRPPPAARVSMARTYQAAQSGDKNAQKVMAFYTQLEQAGNPAVLAALGGQLKGAAKADAEQSVLATKPAVAASAEAVAPETPETMPPTPSAAIDRKSGAYRAGQGVRGTAKAALDSAKSSAERITAAYAAYEQARKSGAYSIKEPEFRSTSDEVKNFLAGLLGGTPQKKLVDAVAAKAAAGSGQ